MDDVDRIILNELQQNGRISNVDLARKIKLSAPATHTRVRQLEKRGSVHKYTALLNREKAGYDMLCFVHIGLQLHQAEQVKSVRRVIVEIPEVLECHHVTGEYDYLLKVVIRNRKDLERFINDRLTPIPGVARIYTSLVLKEVKSTTAIPVE